MLPHKILRTPSLILHSLMRNRLLRNESRNLDPSKTILPTNTAVVIIAAERGTRRRELIEVVVSVLATTDDGGLDLGVCDCACEMAATSA